MASGAGFCSGTDAATEAQNRERPVALIAMPRPPILTAEPVQRPDPWAADLHRMGGTLFWWSWAAFAAIVFMVDLLDVQARLHLGVIHGAPEPAWRPLTDELTSGFMDAVLFPAVWLMVQRVRPRDGGWARALGLHLAAAIAFSATHVLGFVALRRVIYGLMGCDYHFGGLDPFLYELPRDIAAYAVACAGVWRLPVLIAAMPRPAARREAGAVYDIRDGAKVLRVPIADILAVRSAGNYVEFLLADGRTPLMRATLAGVETQLSPHGLARTHRSWLVNTSRIEAIGPAGSGDFRLSLSGGLEAPLSRRFRPAVRAPGAED